MTRWLLTTLLIGVASGCAAGTRPPVETQPADQPRATPASRSFEPVAPMPSDGRGDARSPAGEVPSDLLDRIRADAVARSGIAAGELDVVTAVSVTWRDGSLGCPEPGMMYTMALVPGYHVVLRAGDQELDYRATASGDFRFCADPGADGREPSS